MKTKFKSDKYRKARGGHSRLLDVSCAKCNTHLFYYQKDGPGILKRTYLDRIVDSKVGKSNLVCPKCKELLGVPIIYKKESRPAIRLFEGAVSKKITKSSKLK
ncbi:MAG: hypothetical protein A2918_01160 [Candidatus Yanofskybacteria bacterium RIFCSPLOWO2_01_FULL_42_49]|uniref:Uncharacterized protein n=1 Tax=Candidatus Yanofskybacteria bacterium RIFCSPLOWO2_01_FULL_42_49 TaxID=1802694 RepID=A0A1F8GCE2_9BACT|nr:MAG: hypothetical protein A2918_01160 [Candidatus Yanofskybacteria bacterium RIFCSPLOWO2_01_FULL_42_49]